MEKNIVNQTTSSFWKTDLLAFLFLSLVPLFSIFFQDVFSALGIQAIAGFCFFISFFYLNKILRFLGILILSFLISNFILTLFVGLAQGYILFFYLVNAQFLAEGAILGFVLMKMYSYIAASYFHLSAEWNKRILISLLFIFLIALFIQIIVFVSSEEKLSQEIEKRYELAKRITNAVKKDAFTAFTNEELIQLQLVQDLYVVDGDVIMHGFGGKVHLKKEGNQIFLAYDHIPSGETCFQFYLVNNPAVYGFKKTTVDGLEEHKKEVCDSAKNFATVTFIGTVEELKKQYVSAD